MFLSLKSILKKFKKFKAVDDISIDINKGELVSLLGPSGCGKTTTLKIIGGFLKPDGGRIILDGEDISLMYPENRPVATVFQNYALFPHMTALENVMYGLKYKKALKKREIKEKSSAMLDMVGLDDFYHQGVNNLSGGQRQRVALARALVLKPKVLLLDEPLSNLDAKLRIKMRKDIKEIQKRFGITMIFVTHDQDEALSISDRVVIMNRGKVEQIDTPRNIYKNPANLFVADFVGRANMVYEKGRNAMIRPENIVLGDENGQLWGKIIQKHFHGSMTTYYIESEGNNYEADVINTIDKNWSIGEKISFSFKEKQYID